MVVDITILKYLFILYLYFMNTFSSCMCCTGSDDHHFHDVHERYLLQDDVEILANSSMDGSSHWQVDGNAPVEDVNFIFGGEASNWLCVEPTNFSDTCPDSILKPTNEMDASYDGMSSTTSDITSKESSFPRGMNSSDALGNIIAEDEVNVMIQSTTDPVGKFLRQYGITAKQAVALNIHPLLLGAPKTPRQKYGPRHEQTEEERLQLCKDRNRAHAKATRLRRKLFEKVLAILDRHTPGGINAVNDDMEDQSSSFSEA